MRTNKNSENIQKVAALLKSCDSILFITGAGLSADSGLPTYRGIGGLYNDKETDEGIPIEVALSGDTLSKRPELTWKYLRQIEERCRGARFNRGHEVIAEMERFFPRVWVLTQNIDGFHFAAGSRNVIDIHGDMHDLFCPNCSWRCTVEDYSKIEVPPLCPECAQIVRPDVVFFGERLPEHKLVTLSKELLIGFDIYFSVGTTSVFPYISQPIVQAKYLCRHAVEINPGETGISSFVDVKISLGAASALEKIWKEYLFLKDMDKTGRRKN
ncbi:MAG: NAD-dependent protein deacylase [Candidatus Aureabacteria bacterium]|nr:NAD-dependent protein deacylase [Candidatus Auribacterota bacterium]